MLSFLPVVDHRKREWLGAFTRHVYVLDDWLLAAAFGIGLGETSLCTAHIYVRYYRLFLVLVRFESISVQSLLVVCCIHVCAQRHARPHPGPSCPILRVVAPRPFPSSPRCSDEENKLRSTLQTEGRRHHQPQEHAASGVPKHRYTRHDHSPRGPSSVHSPGENASVRNGSSDGHEEKTGGDIADDVLLALSRRNRTGLDSNGVLSSDRSAAENGIVASDGSGVRGRADTSDRAKRRGRRKSQHG